MAKNVPLVAGQKFNHLTVIKLDHVEERAEAGGRTAWSRGARGLVGDRREGRRRPYS